MNVHEAMEQLVAAFLTSDYVCALCDVKPKNAKPGVLGFVTFEGEQTRMMGAAPGKNRAGMYYLCGDCACVDSTEQERAEVARRVEQKMIAGPSESDILQ